LRGLKGRILRPVTLAALLLTAACATTPGNNVKAVSDPYEQTNRKIYAFNSALDKAVVTPATKVYRAVTPQAAQRGVSNAFNNVDEPWSFVNALMQGKIAQAFRTVDRFLINTVLGVGGLADHATDMGRPEEPEDLGQTLAVWGVNSGPFLILPLFGPSNARDGLAFGIERFTDPYRLGVSELKLTTVESLGLTGLELADTRSYIMDTADSLLKGSADEYATVRAAYNQLRQNEIYDGAPPEEEELPPLPPAAPTEPQPQP
jgi:phospholipid-binding lipoprotein MlaA